MAQAHYDDFATDPRFRASLGGGRLARVTGAIVSVALVAGGIWWGYRLALRDMTEVPVIRAMSDPLRVQAENPGGEIASYRGLAVNAVAADATAEAPPPSVILAPRPVDLAPEDLPGLGTSAASLVLDPLDPAATAATAAPLDPTLAALAQEAAPRAADSATVDPAIYLPDGEPVPESAILRAPPPQKRPLDPVEAALQSAISAFSTSIGAPGGEIDPADIPPGTRLVQLGTYFDADSARAAWEGVVGRAGAVMDGKARVIQPVDSGGVMNYRLRVHGFSSEDDARRFCAAVSPIDSNCMPVVQR
jgi:hypothetical protein